ncbi:MAG TPA: ABC transporter substrate-binding protein [Chloroflexota bacterium]|nr:ABC transporter substrate-binding protein [Chloroflexota bacterium]
MNVRAMVAAMAVTVLAGCGGGAAPAASPSTAPASAASPAASGKPAGSAAAPASGAASAKPAASAAASAAAKPAASGLTPLKGTFTTVSPTGGPLWAAKETGIFARNGLDVTLTSVQATAAMPALTSNDVQFTSSGAAEVASLDLKGGQVVMVAEGAALPIFSLFVDKKYKTVQDLAGQTIGVTSIGAASDTVAHLFLRKYDMEDKVKITGAGGSSPAILAAMGQGLIAGGILIPPVTAKAEQQGYTELINGVKLGVPYTQGSLTMTRSWAKDHATERDALLKSYLQAWQYVSDPANKATMLKIFEQYTKSDAADSEVAYNFMLPLWQSQKVPYMTDEAIKNVLQFLSDPAAAKADPKQFYDNSYLQAVAGEASK